MLLFPWGASTYSPGLLTVGVAGISVLLSCGELLVPAVVGPGHLEGCLVLWYIRQAL